jgi:hypothetical protein
MFLDECWRRAFCTLAAGLPSATNPDKAVNAFGVPGRNMTRHVKRTRCAPLGLGAGGRSFKLLKRF